MEEQFTEPLKDFLDNKCDKLDEFFDKTMRTARLDLGTYSEELNNFVINCISSITKTFIENKDVVEVLNIFTGSLVEEKPISYRGFKGNKDDFIKSISTLVNLNINSEKREELKRFIGSFDKSIKQSLFMEQIYYGIMDTIKGTIEDGVIKKYLNIFFNKDSLDAEDMANLFKEMFVEKCSSSSTDINKNIGKARFTAYCFEKIENDENLKRDFIAALGNNKNTIINSINELKQKCYMAKTLLPKYDRVLLSEQPLEQRNKNNPCILI